jgi:hypothetical protein
MQTELLHHTATWLQAQRAPRGAPGTLLGVWQGLARLLPLCLPGAHLARADRQTQRIRRLQRTPSIHSLRTTCRRPSVASSSRGSRGLCAALSTLQWLCSPVLCERLGWNSDAAFVSPHLAIADRQTDRKDVAVARQANWTPGSSGAALVLPQNRTTWQLALLKRES